MNEPKVLHISKGDHGDFLRVVVTEPGFTYKVFGERAVHVQDERRCMIVIKDHAANDRSRFAASIEELEELWKFLGEVLGK